MLHGLDRTRQILDQIDKCFKQEFLKSSMSTVVLEQKRMKS